MLEVQVNKILGPALFSPHEITSPKCAECGKNSFALIPKCSVTPAKNGLMGSVIAALIPKIPRASPTVGEVLPNRDSAPRTSPNDRCHQ